MKFVKGDSLTEYGFDISLSKVLRRPYKKGFSIMSQQPNKCETPDTFVCEDYEEEEPHLCELDQSKTYKGLVGIYVDDSLITFIDGIQGKLYYRGYHLHIFLLIPYMF